MSRNAQQKGRQNVARKQPINPGNQHRRSAPPATGPKIAKKALTVDFLDETLMEPREAFGCVLFASPGEGMIEAIREEVSIESDVPLATVQKIATALDKRIKPKLGFKYVGGRASVEQCQARIREIENDEPMFHIWTIENGKWVTFDPNPELVRDENFREQELNDLMKNKKLNETKTKEFFRQEMRKRVERARLEGTKEGQEILLGQEEALEAVENRVKSATEGIEEMKEKIIELERTKALAEQKLLKMQADGTGVNRQEALDNKMSKISLATDEDDRVNIQAKLQEAKAMEAARLDRDKKESPNAIQMAQAMEPPTLSQELEVLDHAMFEADVLIPQLTDN